LLDPRLDVNGDLDSYEFANLGKIMNWKYVMYINTQCTKLECRENFLIRRLYQDIGLIKDLDERMNLVVI